MAGRLILCVSVLYCATVAHCGLETSPSRSLPNADHPVMFSPHSSDFDSYGGPSKMHYGDMGQHTLPPQNGYGRPPYIKPYGPPGIGYSGPGAGIIGGYTLGQYPASANGPQGYGPTNQQQGYAPNTNGYGQFGSGMPGGSQGYGMPPPGPPPGVYTPGNPGMQNIQSSDEPVLAHPAFPSNLSEMEIRFEKLSGPLFNLVKRIVDRLDFLEQRVDYIMGGRSYPSQYYPTRTVDGSYAPGKPNLSSASMQKNQYGAFQNSPSQMPNIKSLTTTDKLLDTATKSLSLAGNAIAAGADKIGRKMKESREAEKNVPKSK